MFGDDDMARNVWNEMQADAMPSPEEAEEMHQDWLSQEGCKVCGEDDPDRLKSTIPEYPGCTRHGQYGMEDPVVYCVDHLDQQPTARERAIEKARSKNRSITPEQRVHGLVFYECGGFHYITADRIDEDPQYGSIYEDDYYHDYIPEGPLQCVCGADIDEILATIAFDSE